MQHQTIRGLVIRETDFGDADRYITLLTERGTRIEVLCRGVRRQNGKNAAAVRLFCLSELTLYQRRGGAYVLNDAALIRSFWSVTADMETYALCCYFAELAGAMTGEETEAPAITRLLLYALRALAEQGRPPALVKAAFELRLMAESGFAPEIRCCGACQKQIKSAAYFSVREGALLDADCLRRLGGGDALPLPVGAYAAMAHILSSTIPRVFAFALGDAAAAQLASICERYCLHYAERGFVSLDFYHSLIDPV